MIFLAPLLLVLPDLPADNYPDLPPLAWAYAFGETEETARASAASARRHGEWLEAVRPFTPQIDPDDWPELLAMQRDVGDAWEALADALGGGPPEWEDPFYSAEKWHRERLRDLSTFLHPLAWANRRMPRPTPEAGGRP